MHGFINSMVVEVVNVVKTVIFLSKQQWCRAVSFGSCGVVIWVRVEWSSQFCFSGQTIPTPCGAIIWGTFKLFISNNRPPALPFTTEGLCVRYCVFGCTVRLIVL